jgi:hypothetical protein
MYISNLHSAKHQKCADFLKCFSFGLWCSTMHNAARCRRSRCRRRVLGHILMLFQQPIHFLSATESTLPLPLTRLHHRIMMISSFVSVSLSKVIASTPQRALCAWKRRSFMLHAVHASCWNDVQEHLSRAAPAWCHIDVYILKTRPPFLKTLLTRLT